MNNGARYNIISYGLRNCAMGLLFLASLEFCARIDDVLSWKGPFWGGYSHESLTISDGLGGIRGRPNGRFEKWRMNSFGFRGPEVQEKKTTDVIRIMTVGASETFGLYEKAGAEYPAELQRQLDRTCPGCYEVINAACPGMSPPRIEQAMRSRLYRFEPDIVLFYPSPQFYLDQNPPSNSFVSANVTPLPLESRFLRKARTALKSFLPESLQSLLRQLMIKLAVRRHDHGWVWTQPPLERVQIFRLHLITLIAAMKEIGAIPVLVTHANRFGSVLTERDRQQLIAQRKLYPRASTGMIIPFEHFINNTILETGREQGVKVIDAEKQVGKNPILFADYAHFTTEGASVMASVIIAEICNFDLRDRFARKNAVGP